MNLSELREQCLSCDKCQLCETRTNVVFGTGDEKSPVMFVGEGPGKNEDEQGVPFVGRAGQLLDSFLTAVGLERERVYIANIVKCRPPENRDPLPNEQEACIGWLREQYKIIEPKLIVCLGRVAAQKLISESFAVTREHGMVFEKNGVYMMGTFHPAALLRNPNNKPQALEDFHKIAEFYESFKQYR